MSLAPPACHASRLACARRVGNRLGWAAAAGYLLLFYPLPRSSFLQRLFRCDWSYLIRYHRRAPAPLSPADGPLMALLCGPLHCG